MNWKLAITQMVLIKSKIADADFNKLWPYQLPRIAASDQQINSMAEALGKELPGDYVDFLKAANGWVGFFQNSDLLGTNDFNDLKYRAIAVEEFYSLDEASVSGVEKNDLLVVGINPTDRDLFFLDLSHSEKNGQVIWYAGEEIDRYANFGEFFVSMMAYNERELRRLRGDPL